MRKDILIATNLSLIAGLGLSACKAVGIAPFSPTPESGANSHEFTPTPESDLYPTHFAWMDGRNEVVQKVMAEYGLSSSDIKGFEITVSGLLSATDVHDEKVQFINFIDPSTGLNVSAYYDSKNPNGLLNDFETINRGGGLFVERQLVDLNDPNNYHTLLIISVDAEEKLKSGESTTIEFNPPQWVRAYMPALDPSKNLVINVPIIPELTTTASLGIIPEFLVIDGSVEGIQTPTPTETPSPESLLPQEVGVGISEAESAAIALFDKYGVAPATYTLAEVDGIMVGTDKETGKEIFRGGRFDIGFAIEIAKKDCEPTNFEPDNTKYEQIKNKDSSTLRYLEAILNDSNVFPYLSGKIQNVLIDRTKKCWGYTDGNSFAYRAYRDEVSLGRRIPLIPLLKDERGWFIINK